MYYGLGGPHPAAAGAVSAPAWSSRRRVNRVNARSSPQCRQGSRGAHFQTAEKPGPPGRPHDRGVRRTELGRPPGGAQIAPHGAPNLLGIRTSACAIGIHGASVARASQAHWHCRRSVQYTVSESKPPCTIRRAIPAALRRPEPHAVGPFRPGRGDVVDELHCDGPQAARSAV